MQNWRPCIRHSERDGQGSYRGAGAGSVWSVDEYYRISIGVVVAEEAGTGTRLMEQKDGQDE